MNICAIIPTYNEATNVVKLVPVLASIFKKSPGHDWSVLFVDGKSTDETASVVRSLAIDYTFINLLVEDEKRGLGAAYVNGFKHALSTLDPDVLIEMDADFQHDPQDLLNLIAPLEEGYDYVIGSRFIEGGSIPSNWSLYRRFISKAGNFFAKALLGTTHINDFTSGFKASRVSGFVDKLDFSESSSLGFAYKIDLLYKMYLLKARIKEVPIHFGVRDRGDSKMEKSNLLDSLKVVLRLAIFHNKSFVKFVIVGFLGLFTDLFLFNLLRLTLVPSKASLIAGACAMLFTFTFNNFWSFRQYKIVSKVRFIASGIFYGVSSYMPIIFRSWLVAYAVNLYGNDFFVTNSAFMVGILIGLLWNFTIYSKIIWRDRKK